MNRYFLPVLCFVFLVAGCARVQPTAEPAQVVVEEEVRGRETAVATDSVEDVLPTDTPAPSATPTHTPSPTNTPTETITMTPTPAPTVTPPLMRIVVPSETEDNEGNGLEIVNQTGGAVTAVAVEDSLAYLGIGLRLGIADVSNPENPYVVSWSGILPSVVEQIAVDNDFLYVALGESGFWIFDKETLSSIGSVQTANPAGQFVLQGNLAFIANRGGSPASEQVLSVVDVENPAQPTEVSTFPLPVQAKKLTLVDGYLYISMFPYHADYENTLWIVDISDPMQLKMITAVSELAGRDMIQIETGELLVLGDTLIRVDINDPTNPKILEESQRMIGYDALRSINRNSNNAFAMNFIGDAGYCGGTLLAFDITRIDNLQSLSGLNTDCIVHEVVVSNDSLYMATDHGLSIVDVKNPTTLSYIGNLPTIPPLNQIDIGDFLFGKGRFGNSYEIFAFGVNRPDQPILLGKFFGDYFVNDFAVKDSQVYLATYWEGLISVDMTDPADSQITAVTNPEYTVETSNNLILDNDRLYASLNSSLVIFDPVNLQSLGEEIFEPLGDYYSFVVNNNTLWAFKRLGIFAMDVADPKHEKQYSFLPHVGSELLVDQGFLYTLASPSCRYYYHGCEENTLSIIGVSNPAQMVLLSTLSISGRTQGLAKSDDTLILFGDNVWVIDVKEPTHPQVISQLEIPGFAMDARIKDDLIYVTTGAGGLLILRMGESLQP